MTTRRPLRRGFQGPGPWCGRGATALAVLLLAVFAARAHAESVPRAPAANCALDGGEDRTVTRVIDGETLLLDGGSELKLVGALAPRAFDTAGAASEWPLAEAARAGLDRLVAARNVRIAFAGRRTDRYGRLLAHVFTGADDKPVWVQGEMLKAGLARAYALEGSAQCLAELISQEAVARESATGLWADTTYAVRSADDVNALLRLAGTFQIVEGKVSSVSDMRGTAYVNFGEDWRQDFTIIVRLPARRAKTELALPVGELNGRSVRVRGWIERRGGPMIEVHQAAAIEVLAPEVEVAAAPPLSGSRRRGRRPP